MERVVRIPQDQLDWALGLTPADRLRQANAAFRLYYALHPLPDPPAFRAFESTEAYFRHVRESRERG